MISSDKCECRTCINFRSLRYYGIRFPVFLVTGVVTGYTTSFMGVSHDTTITSGVVAFFALTSAFLFNKFKK